MKETSLARSLQRHLPNIVLILFLIQPVMDVLSYWINYAGIGNGITLSLRFVLLLLMVLSGFILSRKRWQYWLLGGILLALTIGHVAVSCVYGYQDVVSDVTNLIRIYQLPIVALVFITYMETDGRCLDAVKKGFLGSLGLIILVELLATVTGTDPHTYANKGVGVLGWFTMPSAQSAILSMLVPIAIICVVERKKLKLGYVVGIGVIGLGVLYLFATRLSYAALLGCAFGLAVSCLILKAVKKVPAGRAAIAFAVLGVLAILLVNVSPMVENNEKVAANAAIKQDTITAAVEQDLAAAEEKGLSGQELQAESLRTAYEIYAPGVVGRFGIEKVAEAYNYSTDVSVVASARMEKRVFNELLLEEQPFSRIFGIELEDLTFNGNTYDAENDFHGIYYLCGWVGLILLLLYIVFFLWRILRALIKDFKHYFTLQAAGFGIALICGIAHAYFTAGVLRRPNANFYLAVIFAVIYILTETKHRDTNREVETQ